MLMKTITGANVMYVNDIETLSQEQCKQLKCGDKVIEKGDYEVLYVVQIANESEIRLISVDTEEVVMVLYESGDDGWEYNSITEVALGGGGTKLYSHAIYFGSGGAMRVITNFAESLKDHITDLTKDAFLTVYDCTYQGTFYDARLYSNGTTTKFPFAFMGLQFVNGSACQVKQFSAGVIDSDTLVVGSNTLSNTHSITSDTVSEL